MLSASDFVFFCGHSCIQETIRGQKLVEVRSKVTAIYCNCTGPYGIIFLLSYHSKNSLLLEPLCIFGCRRFCIILPIVHRKCILWETERVITLPFQLDKLPDKNSTAPLQWLEVEKITSLFLNQHNYRNSRFNLFLAAQKHFHWPLSSVLHITTAPPRQQWDGSCPLQPTGTVSSFTLSTAEPHWSTTEQLPSDFFSAQHNSLFCHTYKTWHILSETSSQLSTQFKWNDKSNMQI